MYEDSISCSIVQAITLIADYEPNDGVIFIILRRANIVVSLVHTASCLHLEAPVSFDQVAQVQRTSHKYRLCAIEADRAPDSHRILRHYAALEMEHTQREQSTERIIESLLIGAVQLEQTG